MERNKNKPLLAFFSSCKKASKSSLTTPFKIQNEKIRLETSIRSSHPNHPVHNNAEISTITHQWENQKKGLGLSSNAAYYEITRQENSDHHEKSKEKISKKLLKISSEKTISYGSWCKLNPDSFGDDPKEDSTKPNSQRNLETIFNSTSSAAHLDAKVQAASSALIVAGKYQNEKYFPLNRKLSNQLEKIKSDWDESQPTDSDPIKFARKLVLKNRSVEDENMILWEKD
eukprot:Sdes_comp20864_c0_seq1m17749